MSKVSKVKVIPAGYELEVESWENDADNYKTEFVQGLNLAEITFLVKLIQMFYSKNNHRFKTKMYGNMYEPGRTERQEFEQAMQQILPENVNIFTYPNIWEYLNSAEGLHEYLYELGLSGGEFYTRVLNGFKVRYYPTAIEIQDVTDQFV